VSAAQPSQAAKLVAWPPACAGVRQQSRLCKGAQAAAPTST